MWGMCLSAILLGFVAGCSDNPNDKAAKELGQELAAASAEVQQAVAVEVKDKQIQPTDRAAVYAAARQRVQRSVQKVPRTVAMRATAGLVEGNLAAGQADQMQMALNQQGRAVRQLLQEVREQAHRAAELSGQVETLEHFQKALQDEEAALTKLLDAGIDGRPGLRAQLKQAQDRLAGLQAEKAAWMEKHDAAQAKLSEMAAEGQGRLKEAELATGQEKVDLQRKGYELLAAQKPLMIEAQTAADEAAGVQMQIDIVQGLVEQITEQVVATEQKIQAVRSSPEHANLASQLKQTQTEHKQRMDRLAWLSDELGKALEAYAKRADEMVALYGEAAEAYKRARSADRRAATSAGAEALFSAALTAGRKMGMYQTVQWQLQALEILDGDEAGTGAGATGSADRPAGAGGAVMASFKPILSACQTAVEAAGTAAVEWVDKAIGQYEALGGTEGKKRMLLGLYAKMTLADRLGNVEVYDAANTKAQEVMQELTKAEPAFAKSATVQLFQGLIGYVPQLPVDKTAYYEDLKAKFQTWKALRGQAAENEVNRLLAWHDQLIQESEGDPELVQVLEPIQKELQEALAKGFPEEVGPGVADANSVPRR